MKHLLSAVSCAVCVGLAAVSCQESSTRGTALYAWEGIGADTNPDTLQALFHDWKAKGMTGVCMGSGDVEVVREASARAHAEGLEYHAWIPTLLRGGKPHSWYAVNRLGQAADEHPAFVEHYKFLDPANEEVCQYLVDSYVAIARLPEVDYVQLDFIRYPDVILARALWDKFGLDMTQEYAPADYCYCDSCVTRFQRASGVDIRAVEDPSRVAEWAQFRCDQITALVNRIADAVHAEGKKVSADVFPGPASHAEWMVRQQWDKWRVDMLFPMNYNDFYQKGTDWVADMVREEVAAARGIPVVSGLFICPRWQEKEKVTDPEDSGLLPSEMEAAVGGSLQNGAAGVSLFTPSRMSPEHWDALSVALGAK